MKTIHAVLAAAIVLLLAACYPPSTSNPVGKAAPDARFSGLWLGTTTSGKDTHKSYFHFLPQGDGSVTTVMVDAEGKPGGGFSIVTLTTAKVGATGFINARMTESDGKPETGAPHGTIPLLYRADAKGDLVLFLMNDKATKAAITAGKISGTVEKGDTGDAIITADPAALDAFIGSKDGLALFSDQFAILHKID